MVDVLVLGAGSGGDACALRAAPLGPCMSRTSLLRPEAAPVELTDAAARARRDDVVTPSSGVTGNSHSQILQPRGLVQLAPVTGVARPRLARSPAQQHGTHPEKSTK